MGVRGSAESGAARSALPLPPAPTALTLPGCPELGGGALSLPQGSPTPTQRDPESASEPQREG